MADHEPQGGLERRFDPDYARIQVMRDILIEKKFIDVADIIIAIGNKDRANDIILKIGKKLFENEETRGQFFPDDIQDVSQIKSFVKRANNSDREEENRFLDIVFLTIDEILQNEAGDGRFPYIENHIRTRLTRFIRRKITSWHEDMIERMPEAKHKIAKRRQLVDEALTLNELHELLFEEMKQHPSMTVFCCFLREHGYEEFAGERVGDLMREVMGLEATDKYTDAALHELEVNFIQNLKQVREEEELAAEFEEVIDDTERAAGEIDVPSRPISSGSSPGGFEEKTVEVRSDGAGGYIGSTNRDDELVQIDYEESDTPPDGTGFDSASVTMPDGTLAAQFEEKTEHPLDATYHELLLTVENAIQIANVNGDFEMVCSDPTDISFWLESMKKRVMPELFKREVVRTVWSSIPNDFEYHPEELIDSDTRDFSDFVELAIRILIRDKAEKDAPVVEDFINERLKEELNKEIRDLKSLLYHRNREENIEDVASVVECIKGKEDLDKYLSERVANETALMNMFGYALRHLQVDEAEDAINGEMIEILNNHFTGDTEAILTEINELRAKVEPAQESKPDSELASDTIPESMRITIVPGEAPQALDPANDTIPKDMVIARVAPEPLPVTATDVNASTQDVSESMIMKDVEIEEETPEEIVVKTRNNPILNRIVVGAGVLLVVFGFYGQYGFKKSVTDNFSGGDKIAGKTTPDKKAKKKAVIAALNKQIAIADAAVFDMKPEPKLPTPVVAGSGSGPDDPPDATVSLVKPTSQVKAASKKPGVVKSPTIDVKNVVPKSQTIANIDLKSFETKLPKKISENAKFRSLFFGEQVNMEGKSLSKYVYTALNSVSNWKQKRNLRKFWNRDMKKGYVMYMASRNGDPKFDNTWFNTVYPEMGKKYAKWKQRGEKLNAERLNLEKLQAEGKIEPKQKKRLETLQKQYEYGKIMMLSFEDPELNSKAVIPNVNAVENPYHFSQVNSNGKNAKVAKIILVMMEKAGLELPDEYHASLDTNDQDYQYAMHPITPEIHTEVSGDIITEPEVDNFTTTAVTLDHNVQLDDTFSAEVRGYELQKSLDRKIETRGKVMESAADNVLAMLEKNKEDKSSIMEQSADRALNVVMANNEKRAAKLEEGRLFASNTVDNLLDKLESKEPVLEPKADFEPISRTASGEIVSSVPVSRTAAGVIETGSRQAPVVASGMIDTSMPANDNHIAEKESKKPGLLKRIGGWFKRNKKAA